jgi:hypothetical protein
MGELSELSKNYGTDKHTLHCYIDEVYEKIFPKRRLSSTKVLEIGVHGGESIKLWKDYFTNATVYGLDVSECRAVKNLDRIVHVVDDAYNINVINSLPNDFDIMIDDGPHSLESMKVFLSEYSKKIKSDGVLILEDIQDYAWLEKLREATPEHLRDKIQVYDLRSVKNRYDDLVMVIDLG